MAELCNGYQIHQLQYYKWCEQFLEDLPEVFETKQQTKKEERLKHENQRLRAMVGELTMELKKRLESIVASDARQSKNPTKNPNTDAFENTTFSYIRAISERFLRGKIRLFS